MGFETAFLDLMPSVIKVSTRSSHNNYGEATFANTTTSYAARIIQCSKFVRDDSGETVAVSHEIWARSTAAATITVDDRITLPSSVAQDVTPQILKVERYPDEDGVHHTKIMCGQRASQ